MEYVKHSTSVENRFLSVRAHKAPLTLKPVFFRRKIIMKSHPYTAAILLATALLSASAFAKDKADAKLSIEYKAQFGTSELAPGNYKLQWEGTGDNVQVSVLQHGKVVATAPAKLVLNQQLAGAGEVTYGAAGDKKTVNEIDIANSKQSLVFTEIPGQIATK